MFTLTFFIIVFSSSLYAHQDNHNLNTVLNSNIHLHNMLLHESPCNWQPSEDFITTISSTDSADIIALLHTMGKNISDLYRALSQSKRPCRLRTEQTAYFTLYAYTQNKFLHACQTADEQLQICRSSQREPSLCAEQLRAMLETARAHAHSTLKRGPQKPAQRSIYENGGLYFPPN